MKEHVYGSRGRVKKPGCAYAGLIGTVIRRGELVRGYWMRFHGYRVAFIPESMIEWV